jgi:hypothetical protein
MEILANFAATARAWRARTGSQLCPPPVVCTSPAALDVIEVTGCRVSRMAAENYGRTRIQILKLINPTKFTLGLKIRF